MPPRPTKQEPRPALKLHAPASGAGRKTSGGSSSGSVWDRAASVKMLLYGESGTGKTTLWATFPGPILCLLCSNDGQSGELMSIDTPETREKIAPELVETPEQFFDLVGRAGKGGYGTVVLDHASGFSDMILSRIVGKPVPTQKSWGFAAQQQYGQQALQCKDAFRDLLNLDCNVVIVAQQRTFGGKDEGADPDLIKPTVGAALTPSLTGWLNARCNQIVQTFKRPRYETVTDALPGGKKLERRVRASGVEYCLRTEPHEVFQTKFRMPKGRELPECIVDPTYDKIMAVIRGEDV